MEWYDSGLETSGQLGSVMKAVLAVGAGLCNHVLCFRTVWEGSAQGDKGRSAVMPGGGGGGGGGFKVSGFMEWTLPFSAPSAAVWIAMYAQAHFDRYGTTKEQLAWIALNARRNAQLNPKAIYSRADDARRLHGVTRDQHAVLAVRLRCSVRRRNGGDRVARRPPRATLRMPPLRVEAMGGGLHGRPSWDQFDDLTTMANRDAGRQLWTRTDLKPSDVQMLQAYDGFSFITLSWIEALGFCEVGEGGAFIDGGERIARDGQLPCNTHGGQLSAGRLHGYGFLHEAATQMWGEGGDRQLALAPEIGAVAVGGGNTCGCLLLVRD